MDHVETIPVKPKRRWFQFGLKSLLVLPLVVGLLLVLYLYWVEWKGYRPRYETELYYAAHKCFIQDLKAGRLDHAYQSTSDRFKEQMSRTQFDGLIHRFPAVRQGPGTHQVGTGANFRSFNKQTLRNWIREEIALKASDGKVTVICTWVVMDDSFFHRRPPPPRVEEVQIVEFSEDEWKSLKTMPDLQPSWWPDQ